MTVEKLFGVKFGVHSTPHSTVLSRERRQKRKSRREVSEYRVDKRCKSVFSESSVGEMAGKNETTQSGIDVRCRSHSRDRVP
jgi:hypothetical protein